MYVKSRCKFYRSYYDTRTSSNILWEQQRFKNEVNAELSVYAVICFRISCLNSILENETMTEKHNLRLFLLKHKSRPRKENNEIHRLCKIKFYDFFCWKPSGASWSKKLKMKRTFLKGCLTLWNASWKTSWTSEASNKSLN